MCKLIYMFIFINNILYYMFEIIVELKVMYLLRCMIVDSFYWNINFILVRFNFNLGCIWKFGWVYYLVNFYWFCLKVLYLFSFFWILSLVIGWKNNFYSFMFFIYVVIKSKLVWLYIFIIYMVNLILIFICF